MSKGRLTGKAYRNARDLLVKIRGARCWICGQSEKTTPIQVDHVDGIETNNVPENLSLLCEGCNLSTRGMTADFKRNLFTPLDNPLYSAFVCVKKNEKSHTNTRARAIAVRDKIGRGNVSSNGELTMSAIYKDALISWLYGYLETHGGISLEDAINAGACEVGCSDMTARRYIKVLANPINGTLEIADDNGKDILLMKGKEPAC